MFLGVAHSLKHGKKKIIVKIVLFRLRLWHLTAPGALKVIS